jgi:hypothetical protein
MDSIVSNEMKEKLRIAAGIPHLPTDLTYDCRLAIEGAGPRSGDWSDKPHRLVFDLCREIERLSDGVQSTGAVDVAALRADIAAAEGFGDGPPTFEHIEAHADRLDRAWAALPTLLAEREAMRKALEPFARECDEIERDYGDDLPPGQRQFPNVTMFHLRAARSALQSNGADPLPEDNPNA